MIGGRRRRRPRLLGRLREILLPAPRRRAVLALTFTPTPTPAAMLLVFSPNPSPPQPPPLVPRPAPRASALVSPPPDTPSASLDHPTRPTACTASAETALMQSGLRRTRTVQKRPLLSHNAAALLSLAVIATVTGVAAQTAFSLSCLSDVDTIRPTPPYRYGEYLFDNCVDYCLLQDYKYLAVQLSELDFTYNCICVGRSSLSSLSSSTHCGNCALDHDRLCGYVSPDNAFQIYGLSIDSTTAAASVRLLAAATSSSTSEQSLMRNTEQSSTSASTSAQAPESPEGPTTLQAGTSSLPQTSQGAVAESPVITVSPSSSSTAAGPLSPTNRGSPVASPGPASGQSQSNQPSGSAFSKSALVGTIMGLLVMAILAIGAVLVVRRHRSVSMVPKHKNTLLAEVDEASGPNSPSEGGGGSNIPLPFWRPNKPKGLAKVEPNPTDFERYSIAVDRYDRVVSPVLPTSPTLPPPVVRELPLSGSHSGRSEERARRAERHAQMQELNPHTVW
ncbi:hypothetical protein DFJ73DRAFT_856185 [Zopfochytrium polystomum]|nr:hypothetical protein DFJ73DRAFT_856185 [Zopfochytrium polystomum]